MFIAPPQLLTPELVGTRGKAYAQPATDVPSNTALPVISGDQYIGAVLSSTTGSWSNSPSSYSYQWTRDGSNISGATNSTYTTAEADRGRDITCKVNATNALGSGTEAESNTIRMYLHYFMNETLDGASLARAATGDTASYFAADGLMKFAGANTARFDYQYDADEDEWVLGGLLVERQSTNKVLYSDVLTEAAGTGGTLTKGVEASPDGGTGAATFTDYTSTASHYVNSGFGNYWTQTSGNKYTYSAFFKTVTHTVVQAASAVQVSNKFANFNLLTGDIGTKTSEGAETLNVDGFMRCAVSIEATATSDQPVFLFPMVNNNLSSGRVPSYDGDGDGPPKTVIIWGAQHEEGGVLTSFIKTTSSQTTRYAEILTTATLPELCDMVRLRFDDGSYQDISVTGGTTKEFDAATLDRPRIKWIENATQFVFENGMQVLDDGKVVVNG